MHRITPSSPDGRILRDIDSLAKEIGLGPGDYEPYGRLKAKLVHGLADKYADRPLAKYIGVTAINPTPLGEGKTVTVIGLAMALSQLGHTTIGTLREPSLAPVFGIKGGGAGGGNCTLEPQSDINLHFTGDLHAVTSATNLLASIIDNHIARRKIPEINPKTITVRQGDNSNSLPADLFDRAGRELINLDPRKNLGPNSHRRKKVGRGAPEAKFPSNPFLDILPG